MGLAVDGPFLLNGLCGNLIFEAAVHSAVEVGCSDLAFVLAIVPKIDDAGNISSNTNPNGNAVTFVMAIR